MKTIQKACSITVCMTFFFILTGLPATSQEAIKVKNIQAQMSKGTQTCYVVEIPQADLKTAQKDWIKKLQEGCKIKVKEENHELVLAGVVKSEFTVDTINIYSLLIQKGDKILMNVFVEIDSIFFAPKEDKTDLASDKIDNSIRNYVRSFAVDQYRLAVGDELKGQQKVMEKLENDLEKLGKNEENMKKDNSSMENSIDKTEREIKEIEANIEVKNQEIIAHTVSMSSIVGEEERKAAQEKHKELEKTRDKLEKERTRAKDNISSYKLKIEKNNKNIEDGIKLQEDKREEIKKQEEVVKQVQNKLEGIK